MSVLSLLGLEGCVSVDSRIINIAQPKLEEKYNSEFSAVSIGNRMDSDTATIIFEDSKGNRFTAIVENETEAVDDDYIRCVVSKQISEKLKKCFSDIDVCYKTIIISDDCSEENNKDILLDDFKEKYHLTGVMVYLSLKDSDINADSIKGMVEDICRFSENEQIEVSASVFKLSDEDFEKCCEEIDEAYDINNTWFARYSPLKSGTVFVSNKDINPGVNEIIDELS